MKLIKYTNKELYEMQVTGSEAEKYYANKPLTKKQKKERESIMINTILSLIILALIVSVAYLKSKLNVAEYKLDNWRQTALKLNNVIRNK